MSSDPTAVTPFSDPSAYDPRNKSRLYNEHHVAFRNKIRKFVDEKLIPNVLEWERAAKIPDEVFVEAGKVGLLSAICGWPTEVSGPQPEGFDGFFLAIAYDELSRTASGGTVWGITGGLAIGATPLVHCESYSTPTNDPEMKSDPLYNAKYDPSTDENFDNPNNGYFRKVLRGCVDGSKKIALAVSEATAGSDVANLKTTAELKTDPKTGEEYYLVNGLKKWITCGMFADYYTVAARTGGEGSGMLGIELILVERNRPGVSTREMDCMGVKGSGTAFVEFDDVRVPKTNYIGDVTLLLRNFVTERLGLAIQANRFARECLRESIEYIRRRRAFNKKLEDQPVIRAKIAKMARKVLVTQAYLESVVERLVIMQKEDEDWFNGILRLGAEAALAKVQATNTFDFCAKEAAHIHGGNSYVKGNRIESLYRHVLSLSIPGGATSVLEDAAVRLALQGKL